MCTKCHSGEEEGREEALWKGKGGENITGAREFANGMHFPDRQCDFFYTSRRQNYRLTFIRPPPLTPLPLLESPRAISSGLLIFFAAKGLVYLRKRGRGAKWIFHFGSLFRKKTANCPRGVAPPPFPNTPSQFNYMGKRRRREEGNSELMLSIRPGTCFWHMLGAPGKS